MVFDYYDHVTTDIGAAADSALLGLNGQLQPLLSVGSLAAWTHEGATIMNGLDDYPKKTEVTTVDDAKRLLKTAIDNHMSTLSMWAIQRDNGGCPGNGGANNCSGIAQPTWAFSDVLNQYTKYP